MRISDWSSDVCSSDLRHGHAVDTLSDGRRDVLEMMVRRLIGGIEHGVQPARIVFHPARDLLVALVEIARLRRLVRYQIGEGDAVGQIGRASCRERVCKYV